MLPELEAAQGLLKYVHYQIKTQLEGLDEEALNWVPEGVEKVNSIYGLAMHIATSQVAFAGAVAKEKLNLEIPGLEKDGSVFKVHGASVDQAKALLRQAAEITNQIFEKLTPEQLEAETTLPGGGKGTGRSWICLMLTHGGEHVGHMSLTRQLYQHQKK
jgi:uncharacterized damage-inducible protein DinB